MAGGEEAQRRTLRNYVTLGVHSQTPGITIPPVAAHNFELKPVLISKVQQSQFGGSPMEDPNLHLSIFLEVCDTLKINGASTDAIRLRLFPFSLRDKARAWLHSLPPGTISTWDKLTKAFLARFFPPSKMASLRNQINPSAKEKMKPYMRHGSGSKTYLDYAPTVDFRNGRWSKPFTRG